MSEAARAVVVNRRMEGTPCHWCLGAMAVGSDASVCTACERGHHATCWSVRAGCSDKGCINAPLERLDPPAAHSETLTPGFLPPGQEYCPQCRSVVQAGALVCASCKAILSPDGVYHGPKTNAPAATNALIFGIVGFFVCGVIFGPLAIQKSNEAKKQIAADPTLGGEGLATAGMVMGIIDIVAWGLIMLDRAGALK